MFVGCLNVSMPKGIPQAEAAREIKYDLGIRAALAARRDYWWSQLHERLCLKANVEANLQCFAFEG